MPHTASDWRRPDGRDFDQLREIRIEPNVAEHAEGSALVSYGKTKVLCTATFEAKPPSWLLGSDRGWVTAEYGMLPRSTHQRMKRDKTLSGGRTQEISRLIGRSLRAAVDLRKMPERQIIIDCDVINADGGTRTAAVTGGFVALALTLDRLYKLGEIKSQPLIRYIAAVSVGIHKSHLLLDLNYEEDSAIGTDMNFVMTDAGEFVEVQGTAEDSPFRKEQLFTMMDLAERGCRQLFAAQAEHVGHLLSLQKIQLER